MPENKTPIISVVVPVYNAEKYLKKCVDSLTSQTFKDIEIILVDDGSPDNSGELCDELAKTDNRITVIHKENGGQSSARNAGVRAAKADLIGFIDSDDYVDLDMFEMLYNNIVSENADVSVCMTYSCYKNRLNSYGNGSLHVFSGIDMIGYAIDGTKAVISACQKLYKKELLLETPFVEGRIYEDAIFFGELFYKVGKVVVEEIPKYYYVHHESTTTTAVYKSNKKDYIYAYENNLRIIREHCPQYEKAGLYRIYRAYYELLDDAILADNEAARVDKPELKRFLRKNWLKIMASRYIVVSRKLAVTVVLISERLYKLLLKRKRTDGLV